MTEFDSTIMQITKAQYIASAVRSDQYPTDNIPEIAFLGRSNVGKSSLINSLCRSRGLALVSGHPGKTRTINFFSITAKEGTGDEAVRKDWFLVDLPGYGYAKTGRENRQFWSTFIADYVTHSSRLALLCLLIDLRHPGLPLDLEAYNWLSSHNVPLQVIGTKSDKLGSSDRQRNLAQIRRELPTVTKPIAYSSLKHTGRDALLDSIANHMSSEPVLLK